MELFDRNILFEILKWLDLLDILKCLSLNKIIHDKIRNIDFNNVQTLPQNIGPMIGI